MSFKKNIYKTLQKHLDTMPVGFPATRSGVEQRLLKALFTPDEARLATALTRHPEPAAVICRRAEKSGWSGFNEKKCRAMLDQMAKKGSILKKNQASAPVYELVPFAIGMFEFQVKGLSRQFYEDTVRYFKEAFGLEYLSTALPQMRVIPVAQSITDTHHIATYDEIRQIIEAADGRIGVAHCICRKGKDLVNDPCRKTSRRELCFGFRDYFDTYHREGWIRPVSKEEAFEILQQSEKEGLVLQATNEQYPQAVCACCGCCCGVLNTLKVIPNSADFVASNYYARVNEEKCVGCGICVDRCHMEAINIVEKTAVIDPKRCIGCGVCVPACQKDALYLEGKSRPIVPPETTEALYDHLGREKGRWPKARAVVKILRGVGWKDIKALLQIR